MPPIGGTLDLPVEDGSLGREGEKGKERSFG